MRMPVPCLSLALSASPVAAPRSQLLGFWGILPGCHGSPESRACGGYVIIAPCGYWHQVLLAKGVEEGKILFLSLIAAPEGIHKICGDYPKVKVITSEIDAGIDEFTYQVVPGRQGVNLMLMSDALQVTIAHAYHLHRAGTYTGHSLHFGPCHACCTWRCNAVTPAPRPPSLLCSSPSSMCALLTTWQTTVVRAELCARSKGLHDGIRE